MSEWTYNPVARLWSKHFGDIKVSTYPSGSRQVMVLGAFESEDAAKEYAEANFPPKEEAQGGS